MIAVAAVFVVVAAIVGARYQNQRLPVTEVYAPWFRTVAFAPPLQAVEAFDRYLAEPGSIGTIEYFLPGQPGNLWISVLVLLVVGLNLAAPFSRRNVDLVAAQAAGWLLMGGVNLLIRASRTSDPAVYGLIRLVFWAVVFSTAAVLARALLRYARPDDDRWMPAADVRVVAAVAAFTVVLATILPFLHRPDDSTYFTELGGQRLRERGWLPYGDPLLTHTPGAAYAPLMYVAQAGMQALLREPMNAESPDRPVLGEQATYLAPAPFAAQTLLALSQVLASIALFVVGRRWGGPSLGLALVALYNGSSYLLGVGGTDDLLTGMTFVSHIIPASATLVAFACLDSPAAAGALLAVSATIGFYPAFMFPAWLGYQGGVSRRSAVRFAIGFVLVCGLVGAWVLWRSRPADHLGLVATIVRDTLGHHTDPAGYGRSPFGIWGQQTGLVRALEQPLAGASSMTSPFFLLFAAGLVASGFWAVGAGPVGLALLTSAAAIGANIWKIHATATYVEWYYPFFLLGTLGPGRLIRRTRASHDTPVPEA